MADRHSVDEYLETIYFLAFPIGEYTPKGAGSPPLASRVAEMLHVSRASAGEMLKRLEAEGLIKRGARKEALLTASGRARAERVVRKHRIIERLLTDFMGYTAYEAHERADELGDTFSDEMVERIDDKLGHPERCPHGWPVDTDVEQEENAVLAPLASLAPGTRATIVRLAEHDGELLHWFYDAGLAPGTPVEVADDRRGPEVEVVADQRLDPVAGHTRRLGAEALHADRDRMREADRVGDLQLAALRETCGDDVLRHVAGRVRRRAVDLGGVFAGEGTAPVPGHAAIGVDDDLPSGDARVAHRPAAHEAARWIDETKSRSLKRRSSQSSCGRATRSGSASTA